MPTMWIDSDRELARTLNLNSRLAPPLKKAVLSIRRNSHDFCRIECTKAASAFDKKTRWTAIGAVGLRQIIVPIFALSRQKPRKEGDNRCSLTVPK